MPTVAAALGPRGWRDGQEWRLYLQLASQRTCPSKISLFLSLAHGARPLTPRPGPGADRDVTNDALALQLRAAGVSSTTAGLTGAARSVELRRRLRAARSRAAATARAAANGTGTASGVAALCRAFTADRARRQLRLAPAATALVAAGRSQQQPPSSPPQTLQPPPPALQPPSPPSPPPLATPANPAAAPLAAAIPGDDGGAPSLPLLRWLAWQGRPHLQRVRDDGWLAEEADGGGGDGAGGAMPLEQARVALRTLARDERRRLGRAAGGGADGPGGCGAADEERDAGRRLLGAESGSQAAPSPHPALLHAVLGEPQWAAALRAHVASSGDAGAAGLAALVDFLVAALAFKAAAWAGDRPAARERGARLLAALQAPGSALRVLPARQRTAAAAAFHACVAPQNFDAPALAATAVLAASGATTRFWATRAGCGVRAELDAATALPFLPLAVALHVSGDAAYAWALVRAQALVRGWLVRLATGAAERVGARASRRLQQQQQQQQQQLLLCSSDAGLAAPSDDIDFFAAAAYPVSAFGYVLPPGVADPLVGLGQADPSSAGATAAAGDGGNLDAQRGAAATAVQAAWRGFAARARVGALLDCEWVPCVDAGSGDVYYVHAPSGVARWVLPRHVTAWAITPKLLCGPCAQGGALRLAQFTCEACGGGAAAAAGYCLDCYAGRHSATGALGADPSGGSSVHAPCSYTPGADAVCRGCWVARAVLPAVPRGRGARHALLCRGSSGGSSGPDA